MLFPWKRSSRDSHTAESSTSDPLRGVCFYLVKLQTSSTMKPFNQPLTPKESRIQALLEVFWTSNTELLFLDAEFLELSCEEQEAIINELMD